MVTKIKIKCIHCGHIWDTKSQAVYVRCSSCGRKTPARSPVAAPPTAPPGLKRTKARTSQLQDGSTIVGEALSKATGRTIEYETITVPTSKHIQPINFKSTESHSMRLLKGSELWRTATEINLCEICGKKLHEDLRFNVLLDNEMKVHSSCVAEQAVLESGGDLQSASAVWGIPLDVLNKRLRN